MDSNLILNIHNASFTVLIKHLLTGISSKKKTFPFVFLLIFYSIYYIWFRAVNVIIFTNQYKRNVQELVPCKFSKWQKLIFETAKIRRLGLSFII